jgi:hypothetical protein
MAGLLEIVSRDKEELGGVGRSMLGTLVHSTINNTDIYAVRLRDRLLASVLSSQFSILRSWWWWWWLLVVG